MNTICRTCLRSVDKLLPLFTQPELVEKIGIIASVELKLSADFPENICEECVANVKKFYNFRKVIINSHKDLEERSKTLKTAKQNNNIYDSNETSECTPKPTSPIFIKDEITDDNDVEAEETLIIEAVPNIDESDHESLKSSNHDIDCFPENIDDDDAEIKSEADRSEEPDKHIERAIALMKIYKCKSCPKTFPSRFKLSNHRRTEHYPRSICNICGAIIRSDNIKRHVQLHSEGPAECKICGKVCKNSESLRGHSLIHRGEIYTCNICGKSSRLKAEYKRHVRSHENPEIGKFMCSLCGKKIKDLKKHMLSHTGERPHICTYCQKGFTSPYALKVHTRQHTNEKPYMCDYCSMAFPQKVSLVMHIKSKHQTKLEIG